MCTCLCVCVCSLYACVYIHSCLCLLRYVPVSLCVRVPLGMCACFYLYVRVPVYICVRVYNVCGCACTHVPACIWMLGPYGVFFYCSSPYIFQAGSLLNLELTSLASLDDHCEPGSPLYTSTARITGARHHTQLSHGCSEPRSSCVLESTLAPEAVFLVEMLFFVCRGRGAQNL